MRDRRNTHQSVLSNGAVPSLHTEAVELPATSEKEAWLFKSNSPTLPLPVTRGQDKSRHASKRTMAAKALASICLLLLIWQYLHGWKTVLLPTRFTGVSVATSDISFLPVAEIPDHPAAILLADTHGNSKWTMSIPQNRRFPLTDGEYHDMCSHSGMLSRQIMESTESSRIHNWFKSDQHQDDSYLPVDNAIRAGALPKSRREHADNICEKSMTFVLGRNDASFGKSLLLLWMSYGLAVREGRAFFIDDSEWVWGKYTSYFLPPPSPGCMKPPPHHIVPCPHSAKHLVVSSATADWTFGEDFEAQFTSFRRRGLAKRSSAFELLRTGYEDLFRLTDEDYIYTTERVAKLAAEAGAQHSPLIGMQIRRGDLHPFEYQYNMDYLPLERYADGVRSYMQRHYPTADAAAPLAKYSNAPLVLASDDPAILASTDLQHAIEPLQPQRAQDRIVLATSAALDRAVAPSSRSDSARRIDENAGWEGGFYSSLFYALGGSSGSSNTVSDAALQLRTFVGRAYLMDLAVLSHADGVVCAVSSASCRALGVMMGWSALKQGRWVNVDDNRAWSWDGRKA